MSAAQTTGRTIDLEAIRAVVEPIVRLHGVELVDVEWVSSAAGPILRVSIERAGGESVTLEDCTRVSRDTSTALDVADLIAGHYNLEVSSPGIERPLRHRGDFVRAVGKMAKLKLSRPAVDGQRVLRGRIEAADEAHIAIEVDGKRHEVGYADVSEARLVFELAAAKRPQPKRGKRRGRASK